MFRIPQFLDRRRRKRNSSTYFSLISAIFKSMLNFMLPSLYNTGGREFCCIASPRQDSSEKKSKISFFHTTKFLKKTRARLSDFKFKPNGSHI